MHIFPWVFLIFTFFSLVKGYRKFSTSSELAAYCEHQKHFIVNPSSTCCKMSAVNTGINIQTHWDNCAMRSSAENTQNAALEVYACIIKNYNGNEASISLASFAKLMTESYPDDIKAKINEVAGTLDVTADLSDITSIEKLRVSYFDVESQICMDAETMEYGKARACTDWEEDGHRGGKCCGESSFPFDITFNSAMGGDFSSNMHSCKSTLASIHGGGVSDIVITNLADICDLACDVRNQRGGKILQDAENIRSISYETIRWKEHAGHLLPSWLPGQIGSKAVDYAMGKININATVERMQNYEFADTIPGNASAERSVHSDVYVKRFNITVVGHNGTDFSQRRFPNSLIPTAAICSLYKEISLYIEHYLYTENCLPAPQWDTPAPSGDSSQGGGGNSDASGGETDQNTDTGGAATEQTETTVAPPAAEE